ncbi:YqeG family HAD IIIA-type phosphatase [Staphylococcus epidermidis]|uniref:YqeG family HAD IIIA-type phosphatase n=1 Tax=Staphylococcus epidermidis TaxID=1282 RepID=UPI00311A0F94
MNPLFPSTSVESVFSIDYLKLKGMGYKAIIFDIDSTLVPHGDDTTNEIDQLFKYLHKLGFKTLLLSNNSEERISTFNRNIKTLFIPMANKPHRANYLKAIRMLNVNYSEVILVGDQLFTDIIGANLCGIKSILVKFLKHPEDIKIGKKDS